MLTSLIGLKISLLLTALSSPVIILLLHIILSRLVLAFKMNRPPQLICVIAVLLGNILFLILLLFLCFIVPQASDPVPAGVTVPSFLYAFIVYNLMGYTYFHIYNMSETARRVRILYDINSKGSLKKADIEKLYHKGDMVATRVERLLGLKQVKERGNAYVLDNRFLYYAALLLAFWSRLIGLSIMPEGYNKNNQR